MKDLCISFYPFPRNSTIKASSFSGVEKLNVLILVKELFKSLESKFFSEILTCFTCE